MMVMCGNVLMEERNYGIMLNVDWFQLFKYINYFVGVIYVIILNLLRVERFKKKCYFSWIYF